MSSDERSARQLVLLPGWWFELVCVLAAAGLLAGLLVLHERAPSVGSLAVFSLLLVIAENSLIELPSTAGVSPSFMMVMAVIAGFGAQHAVLGAAFVGMSGGINLANIRNGRYTAALFNCGQYLLASVAAASAYVWLEGVANRPAAFAGAVLAFSVINIALVLPQIVLNRRRRPREVWADMRPALPNYLAFGLLGVLVGELYHSLGWVALPLLVVPAAIARKIFASFMELREAHEATVKVFIKAIEAKDRYTAGHTERVAKYALYIGEELRLRAADLEHLRYAALLHDVGKLAVPRRILNKPGRLTEEEYGIVQRHNQVCEDILTRVDFMRSMVVTASDRHAHYERGEQREHGRLVQEAHIVAVADAFDAMTSTRSYRRALLQEVAFAELRDKAGTQFNPECVNALIRALEKRGEQYGLGFEDFAVDFDVPPPVVGVGSAGLGDLVPPEPAK
jgi:hypothetical protein